MKALSNRFDEYVGKLLKQLDAPIEVQVDALGAFYPPPPDYTEPLLELVQRMASQPGATARLPRQLDLLIFERLVHDRQVTPASARRLGYGPATERLVKLVTAFLRGQVKLPQPVEIALTRPMLLPRDR